MVLSKFFDLIIKYGIKNDPRKDKRSITGYADSAILHDGQAASIRKVIVGIDIDGAELMFADRMRERSGCDLVISHHPQGKALAGLFGVIQVQVDVLRNAGVPASTAQGFIDARRREVQRSLLSGNHSRAVDMARLLNLSFICAHTPADNHVFGFIKDLLAQKKPGTLRDIIDILSQIPEYALAAESLCGPKIILGDPHRTVGKVLVEMTGGTSSHKNIYKHMYNSGIRTLVSMHMSEEHLKRVTDANLNVIIAGHISSDTLGMNLLLDNIQKDVPLDILPISGFRRIERKSPAKRRGK